VIYWSNDNGASFETLPPNTSSPQLTDFITIAFDSEFDSNNTVYAATDTAIKKDVNGELRDIYKGIYRFVINQSTEWDYILPLTAPTLIGPDQDFSVKINPISGEVAPVQVTWERPSDEVTKYDLWIALGDEFDEVVERVSVEETGTPVSVVVGPESDTPLNFTPDMTFFWRVRVASDGPFICPWSETRRFTIEKLEAPPPVIIKHLPPQKITVKLPPPEIIVEIPPVVDVAPEPASLVPAYISVVIIIIGSVLVIVFIGRIPRTS